MVFKLDTRKIYFAMAEKGMNGSDLASAIGVSQQAVNEKPNPPAMLGRIEESVVGMENQTTS